MSHTGLFLIYVKFMKYFSLGDFTQSRDVTAPIYNKYLTCVYILISCVVIASMTGGALRLDELSEFALGIATTFNQTLATIKYIVFIVNRKKVYNVIKLITIDRFDYSTDETFINQASAKARRVFLVYMVLCLSFILGYNAVYFIDQNMSAVDETEWYMIPMYVPYDVFIKKKYGCGKMLFTLIFLYNGYCQVLIDLFTATVFMYTSAQFKTIAVMFEKVKYTTSGIRKSVVKNMIDDMAQNETVRSTIPADFRNAIQYHQIVLKCANHLRSIYSAVFFFQILSSCIPLCFSMYLISQTLTCAIDNLFWLLIHTNLLLYYTFQLHLIISSADEITESALSVADGVYLSDWYEGSLPARRAMINILLRSNKSIVYSALGIFDVNMQTFITIIRSAYGALALLTSFT